MHDPGIPVAKLFEVTELASLWGQQVTETNQTNQPCRSRQVLKKIYIEKRSILFSLLAAFFWLWLREKIGHPKKNTVGTYQLQWYGNSICSSNWLAPRGWGIWRPKSLSSLALSIHHLVIPSTGLTWMACGFCFNPFVPEVHFFGSTTAISLDAVPMHIMP